MNSHRSIRYVAAAVSLSVLTACSAAPMSCDGDVKRGINLAGPEFGGVIPGRLNWDYRFPSAKQFAYYKSAGFNAVRLPLKWERLQPEMLGDLDEVYTNEVIKTLDLAQSAGMVVVLDLHNYARFYGQLIGSEAVPFKALADVWRKVALKVSTHPALYAYGLMNEPYNTGGLWEEAAQHGVNGVRSVDRTHLIYVAGDSFSNSTRWPSTHAKPFVQDPVNREVYEAHSYFDVDYSGKYKSLLPYMEAQAAVDHRLNGFLLWLQTHGKRGVIGEWGVPSLEESWLPTVTAFVDKSQANCLPTFIWAGGAWSRGYLLSLEPLDGVDKPLYTHIKQLFARPTEVQQ